MTTPAEVIGRNVKALRAAHGMTAEKFGAHVGEILGNAWKRQIVYLLEQGERRLAAEEVVAIAIVLDVSVADLFTPDAEVDEVQVGRQRIPRVRLLTQGQKDDARFEEVARHAQALGRSIRASSHTLSAQLRVVDDLDRALTSKPPAEIPPEVPRERRGLKAFFTASKRRDYEIAQRWYEPEHLATPNPEGGRQ